VIWRSLVVLALAALFVWIWWKVPPALYRYAEGDRLKAITDTRTALLAGLIGVGALLTFWLNTRVYRITAQTLRVTEQEVVPLTVELRRRSMLDQAASSLVGVTAAMVWSSAARSAGRWRYPLTRRNCLAASPSRRRPSAAPSARRASA
jgi:hypothetical protein